MAFLAKQADPCMLARHDFNQQLETGPRERGSLLCSLSAATEK